MNQQPDAIKQLPSAKVKRTPAERMRDWRLRNPYKAEAQRKRDYAIRKAKMGYPDRIPYGSEEERETARLLALRSFYERNPWYRSWIGAKQRCENPRCRSYRFYGAKGIKFNLTQEQAAFIWERDNAASMDCPSIDRIDPLKDYTLENCRFLENIENSKRGARMAAERKRLKKTSANTQTEIDAHAQELPKTLTKTDGALNA